MENKIYLKIPKYKISYLTKIIEAYDHLGVVSTVNAEEGRVLIHVTPDTRAEIMNIIEQLPFIDKLE